MKVQNESENKNESGHCPGQTLDIPCSTAEIQFLLFAVGLETLGMHVMSKRC